MICSTNWTKPCPMKAENTNPAETKQHNLMQTMGSCKLYFRFFKQVEQMWGDIQEVPLVQRCTLAPLDTLSHEGAKQKLSYGCASKEERSTKAIDCPLAIKHTLLENPPISLMMFPFIYMILEYVRCPCSFACQIPMLNEQRLAMFIPTIRDRLRKPQQPAKCLKLPLPHSEMSDLSALPALGTGEDQQRWR